MKPTLTFLTFLTALLLAGLGWLVFRITCRSLRVGGAPDEAAPECAGFWAAAALLAMPLISVNGFLATPDVPGSSAETPSTAHRSLHQQMSSAQSPVYKMPRVVAGWCHPHDAHNTAQRLWRHAPIHNSRAR